MTVKNDFILEMGKIKNQSTKEDFRSYYDTAIDTIALSILSFVHEAESEKDLRAAIGILHESFELVSDLFECSKDQLESDIIKAFNTLPADDILQADILRKENRLN